MSSPVFHQIDMPKLGSAAAGATEIGRATCNALPVKLLVTKLLFTPDTAITASALVYATVVVKIGATTIATITTDTTANGGTGDMSAATCYDLSAFLSAFRILYRLGYRFGLFRALPGVGFVCGGQG